MKQTIRPNRTRVTWASVPCAAGLRSISLSCVPSLGATENAATAAWSAAAPASCAEPDCCALA
eukprot:2141703-Rhodomonas_salina.1